MYTVYMMYNMLDKLCSCRLMQTCRYNQLTMQYLSDSSALLEPRKLLTQILLNKLSWSYLVLAYALPRSMTT